MKRRKPLKRKALKRSPIKRKKRRYDKPEVRKEWDKTQLQCALCGTGRWLTTHHILGGRWGRKDEFCNFLRACGRCHKIIEGEHIRAPNGDWEPKPSLANILWLKKKSDPKHYDPVRLQEIAGSFILPEPEEPSVRPE